MTFSGKYGQNPLKNWGHCWPVWSYMTGDEIDAWLAHLDSIQGYPPRPYAIPKQVLVLVPPERDGGSEDHFSGRDPAARHPTVTSRS